MHVSTDPPTNIHPIVPFIVGRVDWWTWLEVGHAGRTYRMRVPVSHDHWVERVVRLDDAGDLPHLTGEVGHDLGDHGRIDSVDPPARTGLA